MMKFYKMMFFSTLMTGTLITVSSYSWMSMWMGLEINLLSFIPLMSDQKNLYPSESALKYFITQVMASTILLFSIISMINLNEFFNSNLNYLFLMIFNSSLLTKLGAAPFHFWFPEVMEGLSWMNCLILLTWQKLAPMVILMNSSKMTSFFSWMILFSALVSGILGLNQISLRKIMTYSSINHIGWMLGAMMNSQSIWLIYFITYSVISINIIVIFNTLKTFYLKQLFNSLKTNKLLNFFFSLNFLSLGGLPPFLGFFPKWLTINSLVENGFLVNSLMLILSSLVTLFFYMRISVTAMLMYSTEETIFFKISQKFSIMLFNLFSLLGLFACTLILSQF
uniref:NADH-ubiquinone oxidoreductase chain 2 n=1 Tax=Rhipidocerus australasiae TaxID=2547846 RepID=A0A6H0N1U5_9CUCU|nr:NADH dehydrogenase subunit 2 [Rhipidocerus australasiae]